MPRAGEVHGVSLPQPAVSPRLPAALRRFLVWLEEADQRVAKGEMSAIELAARAYQTLVSIHPFLDANGRTTRLLMDWLLVRHDLPRPIFDHSEHTVARFFGGQVFKGGDSVADDAVLSLARAMERTIAAREATLR